MKRILASLSALLILLTCFSFSSLADTAQDDLILESFNEDFDASVIHPQGSGYAPPTFEITDANADQGTALQVNWAPTSSAKAYVHQMDIVADWATTTFAQNAADHTYLRLWVSNPTFVQIELTMRLYNASTKVYFDASKAIVSRKNGTVISHGCGNAGGFGNNSSITIPSSFAGWVAYPLDLSALIPAGSRTENIGSFSEVNTIQIDMRRPETSDTGTYYVLDEICLAAETTGTLQEMGGDDYEVDDGGPIETELKNVIVLVGDGMGQTILQAARGRKGDDLYMDDMWYINTAVTTDNIYNQLTDSAAAGTALSCGVRTANSSVAIDIQGNALENMVEFFNRAGKKTGLVTTSYLLDATPATYGSHASTRTDYVSIAKGMFENDISVLIGGGTDYFNSKVTHEGTSYSLLEYAQEIYDYTYVDTTEALRAVTDEKVLGLFGSNYMDFDQDRKTQMPISEMTQKAISLLENEEEGFFLMVEGGNIDHAAHNNDFNRTVTDTIAFDKAVQVAMDYMKEHPDTLVVVCSDHSTGGLTKTLTGYSFTTNNHDPSKTACFASGLGSWYFENITENADIGNAVRTAALNVKSGEDKRPAQNWEPLNEAIAAAKAVKEEDYTVASYAVLKEALATAEQLAADTSEDLLQSALDRATDALLDAIDQLEEKPLELDIPTVTAVGNNIGIYVTWNKVANATSYRLYSRYYKDGKWSGWKDLGDTTKLTYTDRTITAGLYYQYTVRACNGEIRSGYKASGNAVWLATPTVTAVGTTAGNKVTWNKIAGAKGYTVYYRYYKSGTWTGWTKIGNTTALTYTHTKAGYGYTFQYTVRAYNGTSISNYKASGNAVRLAQPTVTATGTTTGNKVTWTKSAGASGYTVYYRYYKSGKWTGWTKIGNTTATSYTHTKAGYGYYFQYTVKAYNGTSVSTFKASGNAVRLAQPKVTSVKSGSTIKSTWTKSTGAKGYYVYRRQYNATTKKWSGWTKVATTTALSYTDKSTKAGIYYQYTARAYNGTSQSTYAAGKQVKR